MPFGTVKLNDGNKFPAIAFGTGSSFRGTDGDLVTEYVEQALELGFWHIDSAAIYKTEPSVRQAIKESGIARQDLYLTTKYDGGNIRKSVEESLQKIGVKQLDMYLIHAPKFVSADFETAWREFEKIKEDGLSKSIGVSNFTVEDLQSIVKIAKIKPAVNQISFNPYNYKEHKPLLEYAAKHGIVIEAYSSLAPITKTPGGPVDAVLESIAQRIGGTPAQVIFAWVRSKNVTIVTQSSKKEHMKEYLAVADLSPLTAEEITAIDEASAKGPPFLFQRKRAPAGVFLGLMLFHALRLLLK